MTKTRMWAAVALLAVFGAGEAAAKSLSGTYLAARQAAQRNDLQAAAEYYAQALAMDPGNNHLREQAMSFAVMSGDMRRAVAIARALAQNDPQHTLAVVVLTIDDIKANRLESARTRLTEGAHAFTPLLGGLLRGWVDHGLGDRDGVETAFTSLGDSTLFQLFGKYHLGLARAAAGDLEGAVTAYEEATALANRATSRMARAHGAALQGLGRDDAARAVYVAALAASLGDLALERALQGVGGEAPPQPVASAQDGAAEVMLGLSEGLTQDQGSGVALVYAQFASFLRPDLEEAKLLIAELLDAQEQYDLALAAFADIPADSPLHVGAEIGRAEALFSLDRKDEALTALRALAQAHPYVAQAQVALGDNLRRSERFEEAAVAYGAAIDLIEKVEPRHWVLFYERGISRERSDQWDAAEADFRKALELMPDQPLVLNYLGYSLVEKRRNLDEAQEMIRKAVAQRPDDGYITDSLGWVLYRLGKYEEAVVQMERAAALMPVDPIINDHLGDVLWMVGRKLEAEFHWRRALSFDPEDADAKRIRDKLVRGLDAVLADEAAAAAAATEQTKNGG